MPDYYKQGLIDYYTAEEEGSSLASNTWFVNKSKRHAYVVYDDYDALKEDDEKLVPETTEPRTEFINDFTIAEDAQFFRTKAIPDDIGGEDVELDLQDRIISLLMDQSGSMTWNDNEGSRYKIAKRLVNRVAQTYPGDVKFNLQTVGGEPIDITLFALTETPELNSNNVQEVSSSLFQDEESRFAGIRVVRKEGSYPEHPLDGDIVSEGFFKKAFSGNLVEDTTYYYTIYSFDKNFRFSRGVNIKATPRQRDIPRGIVRVASEVVIGSGVRRDSAVIGSWHFDESIGPISYDFSNSKFDIASEKPSPSWLGVSDVPVGRSGIRFDGRSEAFSAPDVSRIMRMRSRMSFMFWLQPYDFDVDRTIVARQNSTQTNFSIIQNNEGGISFSIDGANYVNSLNNVLEEDAWNHVAVTVDLIANSVKFYINGSYVNSATLPSLSLNDSADMWLDIGVDRRGINEQLFGRFTELSIHTVVREADYISQYGFVPDETSTLLNPFDDNGDRIVIIQYEVPDDYNYPNGAIRILRRRGLPSTWEEDGEIVQEIPASPGVYYLTDTSDFATGFDYYYRLYSRNTIGNYSTNEDSPILAMSIPSFGRLEELEELSSPIAPVSNVEIHAGNNKTYLTWLNPALEERFDRVEIYASKKRPPTVSERGSTAGNLVYTGYNLTDESFLHFVQSSNKSDESVPENAKTIYYTIVVKDKYGRVSSAETVSATPVADADESPIPLLDVYNVSYQIVDNESISLQWNNPVVFNPDIEGWLDQRVFIYAAITDEFGQPISDDTDIDLSISSSISENSQGEDVFADEGQEKELPPAESFFVANSTKVSNGIIRGTIRVTDNPNLTAQISSISFGVSIVASVPDAETGAKKFTFTSTPLSVNLKNPWSVNIINRDGRRIKEECPAEPPAFAAAVGLAHLYKTERSFDGAYVRASNPFVARVYLSFRDEPLIGENEIQVSVWDAQVNLCDPKEWRKENRSSTVLTPATTLPVKTQLVPSREGGQELRSFVDVPLTVPDFPQKAVLIIKASYNGYISIKEFNVVMQNILKIDMSGRAPVADGVDVAEQQASVYLLDPDFPEDESKRTKLPDLTVVDWKLEKKRFAKDRPFYSTDNVPRATGVASFVRNGVARQVWLGPVSGVKWTTITTPFGLELVGEVYEVRTSVVYAGLSAEQGFPIHIIPLPGIGSAKIKSGFLMEMPSYKNRLWADGEDYIRAIIVRDPNSPPPDSKKASCFKECIEKAEGTIVQLDPGQIINLKAGSDVVEILWGDVIETVDPYCANKPILQLGPNANREFGSAFIEIEEGQATPVYFRVNGFYPPPEKPCECAEGSSIGSALQGGVNQCDCLGIRADCPLSSDLCTEYIVSGETRISVEGEPERLDGGGDMKGGLPPTILVPDEPLLIRLVDIRVDGQPNDSFIIDGQSINELVVEVSFADCPVPDGTPVFLENYVESLEGDPRLTYTGDVIYTQTRIDPLIDSVSPRSYASITFDPILSDNGFDEGIIFTTTYNKIGDVEREDKICVRVVWRPAEEGKEGDFNIYNEEVRGYALVDDGIIGYDPYTGQIIVSYDNETDWEIDSSNEVTNPNNPGNPQPFPPPVNIDFSNPALEASFGDTGPEPSPDPNRDPLADDAEDDEGSGWIDFPPLNFPRGGLMFQSNYDIFSSIALHQEPSYYFRFSEVSTYWPKEEIQSLDGFYHNNPKLYSQGSMDASSGTAVTLNGVDNYISTRISLNVEESFSIVVIVKVTDSASAQTIVQQTDGTGVGRRILYVENGKYNTELGGSTTVGPDVTDGSYDYVVLSYDADAGEVSFSVNADISTVVASVTPEPCDGDLLFGVNKDTATGFFDGTLDELLVYEKSLTNVILERLYKAFASFGEMYAIGGIDAKSISKINERYVLKEAAWEQAALMPTPRFLSHSVFVNGKIYCFGGISVPATSRRLAVIDAVEAYDPLEDEWEILSPMPTFGDSASERKYALSMATAQHVRVDNKDKVVLLGGVTEVTNDGLPRSMNNRILIYDVESDSWTSTEQFTPEEELIGLRIAPMSFVAGDEVIVVGGSVLEDSGDPSSNLELKKDSFAYNYVTGEIRLNDSDFSTLPTPRFRGAGVSDEDNHYFLAGTSATSQTTRFFEKVDATNIPFAYERLSDIPESLTGSAVSVATTLIDPIFGVKYLFIVGGWQSGRAPGFLQIRTNWTPQIVRLDGKQSCAISVDTKTDSGEGPGRPINIRVRGYLKFDESSSGALSTRQAQLDDVQQAAASLVDDEVNIYSVLFASQLITTNEQGQTIITLLPRADDILEAFNTLIQRLGFTKEEVDALLESVNTSQISKDGRITIKEGDIRFPYRIVIEMTVLDEFFYGQTIEEIRTSNVSNEEAIEDAQDAIAEEEAEQQAAEEAGQQADGDSDSGGESTNDTQSEEDEGESSQENNEALKRLPKLDENGDPVRDENGNVVFEEVRDPCLPPVIIEEEEDETEEEEEDEQAPEGDEAERSNTSPCEDPVNVKVRVDWTTVSRGASTDGVTGVGDTTINTEGGNQTSPSSGSSGGSGSSGEAQQGANRSSAEDEQESFVENREESARESRNPARTGQSTSGSGGGDGGQQVPKASTSAGGGVLSAQQSESENFSFSLEPPPFRQHTSPEIQFYNDINWIPTIKTIIGGNAGDAVQVLNRLENLANEIPFGASAIYDALVTAARILSDDDVDGKRKTIYIFTDNEANLSRNTLEDAIDEINAIDGEEEVPSIVGNFAVVDPATLSARANASDTDNLNKLAKDTGGQAATVLSDEFEDDIVQIFLGEAVGSMGYGTYSFLVDLGEVVKIRKVSSLFNLFENTNGNWRLEISSNGFEYTPIDEVYKANAEVSFDDLSARYIRFNILLTTGFSASNEPEYELIPLPASPSYLSSEIEYETSLTSYLYLHPHCARAIPQQVVVSVNAKNTDREDVEIGVSTSRSNNWLDYQSSAQLGVQQNGKIFIPIRNGTSSDVPTEPLVKLDSFTFQAHYGRWNPEAIVEVTGGDGKIVSPDKYKAYPREGIIVFAERTVGFPEIRISDRECFSVGVRMTTRSSREPLEIYGIGYMFNSNVDLLPPAEAIRPEISDLLLLPDEPTPYTTFELRYKYRDVNQDEEDTDGRVVRWFINGVRVPYLDNEVKWNDLENSSDPFYTNVATFSLDEAGTAVDAIRLARENKESIVKVGDIVSAVVEVSDGVLLSEPASTNVVTVVEGGPVLTGTRIVAEQPNGSLSDNLTTNDTAILKFDILADTESNISEVVWYLNDEEFKRGIIGIDEDIDRIAPGEVGDNGEIALIIGNELYAEVIPQTEGATGEAVVVDTLVVQNGIPIAQDVFVGPGQPSASQNLKLTYTFIDSDIEINGDATQSDQSTIRWYYKDSAKGSNSNVEGNNDFIRVEELDGEFTVPSTMTKRGQVWVATIRPYDGFDFGQVAESNPVTIG